MSHVVRTVYDVLKCCVLLQVYKGEQGSEYGQRRGNGHEADERGDQEYATVHGILTIQRFAPLILWYVCHRHIASEQGDEEHAPVRCVDCSKNFLHLLGRIFFTGIEQVSETVGSFRTVTHTQTAVRQGVFLPAHSAKGASFF